MDGLIRPWVLERKMSEVHDILSRNPAPQQRRAVEALLQHVSLYNIPAGGRLPSIRDIVGKTGLGHVTVAKAIKYLADNGVVQPRGREGTVLLRDIAGSYVPNGSVQRFVILHCLSNLGPPSLTVSQSEYETRTQLKAAAPGADIASVIYSPGDGRAHVEKLIHFYYVQPGQPRDVVFLLGNAPLWVKLMFQERKVPSIVLGGAEEGVSLPCITFNIRAAVDKVLQLLGDADAYPATFILDVEELIGEQVEMVRRFNELADHKTGTRRKLDVLRTSNVMEVFRGQLTQYLLSDQRPRVLITRGDDTAIRVARVCAELGLHGKVKILSMNSTTVGEQFVPSISGLCRDPDAGVRAIVEISRQLLKGDPVTNPKREIDAIMVYRETFANPYMVQSRSYANGKW